MSLLAVNSLAGVGVASGFIVCPRMGGMLTLFAFVRKQAQGGYCEYQCPNLLQCKTMEL